METNIEEIWKPVLGYEGLYEVSTRGRVKSIKRGIYLRPGTTAGGYLIVDLCKNRNRKIHKVHILTANAFIGHSPEQGLIIDHINRIPSDNRVENLRRITTRENLFNTKRIKSSKYRGVSFNKKDKIWQACIYTNGVNRYLGRGSETKCRDLYISALEAFEKQSEKK